MVSKAKKGRDIGKELLKGAKSVIVGEDGLLHVAKLRTRKELEGFLKNCFSEYYKATTPHASARVSGIIDGLLYALGLPAKNLGCDPLPPPTGIEPPILAAGDGHKHIEDDKGIMHTIDKDGNEVL